jgi:hypothetical protein
MGQWTEEKPTMYLRFVIRDGRYILQQQWKITRGGLGRIEYTEEWRDVSVMSEEAAK